MKCFFDQPEAIGFDDVAKLKIENEAANDHPIVELQIADGPAFSLQLATNVLVRALLPILLLVVHERVVHVVSDGAHLLEVDGSIAIDAASYDGFVHEQERTKKSTRVRSSSEFTALVGCPCARDAPSPRVAPNRRPS